MSHDEGIRARKDEDEKAAAARNAPDNPAGEVSLSDEDLGTVAGGTDVPTMSCTGNNTYCHGTCSIPASSSGCCN